MKTITRWDTDSPKRTLLVVAIAVALGGSMSAAAAGKDATKADKSVQSADQMFQRPEYTDDQWSEIARSSLAVRVQSNLANSASLRGADITVTSDGDGEVTLSGTVVSDRQKERALRVAERTAGVSDVDDELEVDTSLASNPYEPMDDDKLAQAVAQAIAAEFDGAKVKESWFFGYQVEGRSESGRDWTLEVDADEGEITLDGELARNEDISKALQATRRIAAVRSIDNEVTSNEFRDLSYAPMRYRYYAPGYMYSGTLVTAKGAVQGELVCQLASYAGPAPIVTKARLAETTTASKPSPTTAAGLPTFSDEEWQSIYRSSLAVRVQSNLASSASLRGTDVSVNSHDAGQVTLSGKVSGEPQKARALRIAKRTPGVTEVNDKLEVDEKLETGLFEPADDEKLAQVVAQAIAAEFDGSRAKESWFFGYHVEGRTDAGRKWKVSVDADDGEISLDGSLPRNEDVQKVLQVTRRIAAVRNIENDIDSNEERYLSYAPEQYRYHAPGYMHPGPLVTATGPVQGELVCQVAGLDGGGKHAGMVKTTTQ